MSIDRPREQHTDDHDEPPRDTAAENGASVTATGGASGTAAVNGEVVGVAGRESRSAGGGESIAAANGKTDAAANRETRTDRRDAENAEDREIAEPTRRARTLPVLLVIAAFAFALDLSTKALVVANMTPGEPVSIIGDVVRFVLIRNPGAAFSMATGMTWLLTLIAVAVVVGVIRIGRSLRSVGWAVGLGLVLGGAVGNLIDRLFRAPGPLQGHVVDFISVTKWWPVFNVADSSIVCGAILLVVLTVLGFEPDGTRNRSGDSESDDSAGVGA